MHLLFLFYFQHLLPSFTITQSQDSGLSTYVASQVAAENRLPAVAVYQEQGTNKNVRVNLRPRSNLVYPDKFKLTIKKKTPQHFCWYFQTV